MTKILLMKTLFTLLLVMVTSTAYLQSNSCACCGDEYKKFDFWAGNWNVTSNGQQAGTNNITYIQDGCILMEDWVGASGSTGSSMNFYDKTDKTWNQLWIDNQGNALKLKGQFDGTSMVLMSTPAVNQNNQIVIHKISWTPLDDGSVRQLWESTQDGGNQWNILFDGNYVKIKG